MRSRWGSPAAASCIASSTKDCEPDLVVFGKGLGGGLPLSAVIGPRAIMDHAPAFALQTTGGNPVADRRRARGAAGDRRGGPDRARRTRSVHDCCRADCVPCSARHPMIGDVRGRGLALGRRSRGRSGSREAGAGHDHGESDLSRLPAGGGVLLRRTARQRTGIHAAADIERGRGGRGRRDHRSGDRPTSAMAWCRMRTSRRS